MIICEKSSIFTNISKVSSTTVASTSSYKQPEPTWYNVLPFEILALVFRYFEDHELRNNFMPVCRQWKYAALRLQTSLEVHGHNVPTDFICRRIRTCINLKSVVLDDIAEPDVVVRQLCRSLPKLKHFALKNCGIIPDVVLRNLVLRCKELQELDFTGTAFKGQKFYEEVAGLRNLKSVDFGRNPEMTVKNLMTVVLNCHRLEELKVSKLSSDTILNQLTDEDASFMVSKLCQTLKTLCFNTTNLSNATFETIFKCKNLETLQLYGTEKLSPGPFMEISKNLPNLTCLAITQGYQIGNEHFIQLFNDGKQTLQHLKELDFTGCWKIGDSGIEAILNCCNNRLEFLTLKGCKSISSLKSIRDCVKLKHLNIAFCSNLEGLTLKPLPDSLVCLVIDGTGKFKDVANYLVMINTNASAEVRICQSEYRDEIGESDQRDSARPTLFPVLK